ncbi:MAG: hypothetical protein A2795_13330 [Caulobacterales bacterium RIFCSPHIGHO2_01_FULL_67_30]|nr:MAG: hypothetical protein A2795_13330 [Caulobacterales bacterium RIFCSPHIGHO2_01_FULL_67_30]
MHRRRVDVRQPYVAASRPERLDFYDLASEDVLQNSNGFGNGFHANSRSSQEDEGATDRWTDYHASFDALVAPDKQTLVPEDLQTRKRRLVFELGRNPLKELACREFATN